MTTKQKQNIARFKEVQAEAKKLKAKNKNLSHIQAVKQAWAILYSKEKSGKKVGEVKKTAAIMRDRKYRSNEKHELAYKRKSSPKNPRYKSKYKQKVGALPIGFTGKIVGVPFKVVNQFDIYGEVNAIVENTDTGKKIIVIDGKASTKDLAEKFFTHIKMNVDYEKNEIPKDTLARISKFVIGLNKEVKDYNAGKKQTIKKQPLIIAAKKITSVKKSPSTKKSKVVEVKKTARKKSSSTGSKKLTYVGVRKLESGESRYQYKLAGIGIKIGNMPSYSDPDAAREIQLYADSDYQLYNQRKRPILINLGKKYKKGTFDVQKAAKLWRYYIDAAMQKYNKEHGSRGDRWYDLLSIQDRNILALEYAIETKNEFDLGNFTT